MADIASKMLHESLIAFAQWDEQAARRIPGEDDQVDHLYNVIYRDLIDLMIAEPRKIDRATYLLWVAHNLERIADRVTNICERIIFVITGELVELDQTDDEMLHRKLG
jgi:phosphate transport system protein